MKIVELNKLDLDKLNQEVDFPSFVQSSYQATMLDKRNRKYRLLGFWDQDQMIGWGLFNILPLAGFLTYAHCNQGPSFKVDMDIDWLSLQKALIAYLKKDKVVFCLWTPSLSLNQRDEDGKIIAELDRSWFDAMEASGLVHQGFTKEMIHGLGRWFFVKDLRGLKDRESLRESFDADTRYCIRKAERLGIQVEELSLKDLDLFMDIMDQTGQRRGFSHRDKAYYQAMMEAYGSQLKLLGAVLDVKTSLTKSRAEGKNLEKEYQEVLDHLKEVSLSKKFTKKKRVLEELMDQNAKQTDRLEKLLAKGDKIIMAAAMFVAYQGEMTYLFSGALDDYFSYYPSYCLLDEAMSWALDLGCRRFNYYGTTGSYSGHQDDGVYQFKKGFGGHVVEEVGDFKMVVSSFWNALYNLAKKIRG